MDGIPFVIDNQRHRMGDTLNTLLQQYQGQALDMASAYFNVAGWQVLAEGLYAMGSVRLLLGDEPEAGADIGLREVGSKPVKGLIKDLSNASFDEQTLRAVEDLTAFLRQDHVQVRLYTKGFLHAKCYLFYGGGGLEHFQPVAAIVGSSNFTRAGLLSNKELNLVHRANLRAEEIGPERLRGLLEAEVRKRLGQLQPEDRLVAANLSGVLAINELAEWYDRQWEDARDFKEDLLDLLDASKFGRKIYTPYQVYMKAIYEYFRDDLDAEETAGSGAGRSAIELSEFQEDAVKKARRLLARYDGVMIADSVGLGKTWIGKKLLEDYAYHLRYRAVIVCPAALQKMWQDELLSAGIAAMIVTQEALGREGCGGRIEENRYILTNLIQCSPDTMRVVPLDGSVDIFALQEKVIASILQSSIEQRAVAEAPKLLDPLQQTISTTLRGYVHSPLVSRKEVIQALQCLNKPLPGVYLKALRKAYEAFLLNNEVRDLLVAVQKLDASTQTTDGEENGRSSQSIQSTQPAQSKGRKELLQREDLRLICFDYIWH